MVLDIIQLCIAASPEVSGKIPEKMLNVIFPEKSQHLSYISYFSRSG